VTAQESLLPQADKDSLDDEALMPDFKGLTIREALRIAKVRSIDLDVSGSGWAVRQLPEAHSVLGGERVCKIVFEMKN